MTIKQYLVGGAVRDELLGLDVNDRDWVVVGSSEKTMTDLGHQMVGKDFPVFLVDGEEVALARTERKTGDGYGGFSVDTNGVTLEEDLGRRDLTINSIAQDEEGNLIDPYGGRNDINNKLLRHTSDAFSEDPVRVLRTARFFARYQSQGFTIADETIKLMQDMTYAGELNHLTAERVWQEIVKTLNDPQPWLFFDTLQNIGALKVILPELNALFGVPQPAAHHPEIDTGIHTLMVLEQACKLTGDPVIRFAALMHDLGKGIIDPKILPHHYGHEAGGLPLLNELCKRLRVPSRHKKLAARMMEYHTHCHKLMELRPGKIYKLLKALGSGGQRDVVDAFATACEADARGRTGFENRDYPNADYLRKMSAHLKLINNDDIVERYSGKKIGEIIDQRMIKEVGFIKHQLLATTPYPKP